MKINKRFILSFVAPLMILISAIGMILRDKTKKIFYLPIGLMGISIILEKDVRRRLDRENILKKIKSYQKANTRGAKKFNLAEIIPFEPESLILIQGSGNLIKL